MIAEFDRGGHGVADLREYVDGLGAEIERTRLVVAFPGQHFLAYVPL